MFKQKFLAKNVHCVGDMEDRIFALDTEANAKSVLYAYDFNCKTGKVTQVTENAIKE